MYSHHGGKCCCHKKDDDLPIILAALAALALYLQMLITASKKRRRKRDLSQQGPGPRYTFVRGPEWGLWDNLSDLFIAGEYLVKKKAKGLHMTHLPVSPEIQVIPV